MFSLKVVFVLCSLNTLPQVSQCGRLFTVTVESLPYYHTYERWGQPEIFLFLYPD